MTDREVNAMLNAEARTEVLHVKYRAAIDGLQRILDVDDDGPGTRLTRAIARSTLQQLGEHPHGGPIAT